MKREIKFRVWHKREKRYYMNAQSPYGNALDIAYKIINFGDLLDNNDFIVEQFTGLKDKNGTDIYEGDIVVMKSDPDNEWVVEYDDNECAFVLVLPQTQYYLGYCFGNEYTVVGNIHEN